MLFITLRKLLVIIIIIRNEKKKELHFCTYFLFIEFHLLAGGQEWLSK